MRIFKSIFQSISPLDYRYVDEEVIKYLSEDGFTRYKLRLQLALVRVFTRHELCSEIVLKETESACERVTTAEVYEEEKRIGHDIRALVNRIRAKVSKLAKSFIHRLATSYDITDSANAARYKDVVEQVLIPWLIKLEAVLIDTTLREADTVQIGRTHGQHAVPITFGFAIAGYVSRLGNSIETLRILAQKLPGKFAGAVGAYNASSLCFENPEGFEAEVLAEVGLISGEHATQIVQPEALTRLLCELVITAGVLANLADDMRHLQRTEIAEVGEAFKAGQVGSSTMPQKVNPISFENVKSIWKIVIGRIITVFMDQISEHQRDLTNSASGRTYGEIIAYVVYMTKRLSRTMQKLTVNRSNMERNLHLSKGLIAAEPLYIILAVLGHSDAHEKVLKLTLQAQQEGRPLEEVAMQDRSIRSYFPRMTPYQREIISNPLFYTGIAAKKARAIAERWKKELEL